MSLYVDLGTLKTAVGIDGADTNDDALLTATIARASEVVDNYLTQIRPGYVGFAASSNTRSTAVGSNTRHYDGSGSEWLWIDDASSVSSVTVDDDAIDMADVVVWPYNDSPKRAIVYKEPSYPRPWLGISNFPRGTRNVSVVGYWGLNSIPNDVVQVTLSLCILFWRRHQSGEFDPLVVANSAREGQAQVRQYAITTDPEVMGLLSTLDGRWALPGVWGG